MTTDNGSNYLKENMFSNSKMNIPYKHSNIVRKNKLGYPENGVRE